MHDPGDAVDPYDDEHDQTTAAEDDLEALGDMTEVLPEAEAAALNDDGGEL